MSERYDPKMDYREEADLDFDLSKTYTVDSMLQTIRDKLPKESKLLSRSFIEPMSQSSNGKVIQNGHVEATSGVKIMQFNILAQGLASGADNFILCPERALRWDSRRYRILEEILLVDPDILCMQEVDHFHFFKVLLEKIGYDGSFFPKVFSPCLDHLNNNGPDGCAVFYKTSKLDLLENHSVVLQLNGRNSNQVSIMYKLRTKNTGKEFCMATTHLKAKSGHEKIRFGQGTYLLEEAKRFSQDLPLIVCGDFNADPSEPVIEAFTATSSTLQSSYRKLSESGNDEPKYTTWKVRGPNKPGQPNQEACRTIDYIWYRPNLFRVESLFSIPTEEQIGIDRLPSWTYPSDHFSLAAVFSFI